VDGYETLQIARGSIALHCPFSLSERKVAVLGAVVKPFVGPVLDTRRNLTLGRAVGSQLIGNEAFRGSSVLLHQSGKQTFGCSRIASALKDFIQNNTVLVNRTPQPELTALNRNNDFVQMPDIARLRLAAA